MGVDSRLVTGAIVAVVLLSTTLQGAAAENFTVGDQSGWIVPVVNSGLNYTLWAQAITAHVGDTLYFKYNPNTHDVLKVNASAYAACNSSRVAGTLQTWDNGDTTVVLEAEGTHYFICGALSHCALGQAFSLDVAPVPSRVTPPGPSVLSPPGKNSAVASVLQLHNLLMMSLVSLVLLIAHS